MEGMDEEILEVKKKGSGSTAEAVN